MSQRATSRWRFWLRFAVIVVVLVALCVAIVRASADLKRQPIDWSGIGWWWLALAMAAYLGSMSCGAIFWHLILRSMKQRPNWRESFRAFFLSQLGKYVPGKAMVVVIRAGAISSPRVRPAAAVAGALVETLTWVAVAAAIGLALAAVRFQPSRWLTALTVAVLLGVLLPTLPPVFRRLCRLLGGRFGIVGEIENGVTYTLAWTGWFIAALGWSLAGLSLWSVSRAVGGVDFAWTEYSLALMSAALATAIGFVSLLPGGLGVRELVMIPLLSGPLGAARALAVALAIRLVWIACELLAAAFFYSPGRMAPRSAKAPTDSTGRLTA